MELTIYDFSKILTDLDSLSISDYHADSYFPCPKNHECYRFHWSWNGYSGSGAIYLKNGLIITNNKFCEQSQLSISSDSIRQAAKHVSEVYNEPALAELLQYIANKNKI